MSLQSSQYERETVFLPCLLGPTGVGKSAAALALAESLPVSVINADSRQVYRDFPLITAQPSEEEKNTCPHLLYGFLPTERNLGAGEYARLAAETVAREQAGRRVPILVGGTGLYLRALFEGIAPIPEVPHAVRDFWQQRCDQEGSAALHALLREKDARYAARIHPHDRQRITRALEVWDATGKSLSWWHDQPVRKNPFLARKVGVSLPLAELEPLLARRIDSMLTAGALEEARSALRRCADASAPGWSGIGCSEIYQHLVGDLSLAACRELWLRNTRAYAKRQLTWFRADKDIRWFSPEEKHLLVSYVKKLFIHKKFD